MNLLTPRLRIRPIESRDHAAFVAMNLDPDVMHFFPGTYPPEKSEEHLVRYQLQLARDGYSFITLEHRHTGQFLGIAGLQTMTTIVPNLPQPAYEIGWRLTREAQGHGYATEAARAIVDHAFHTLNLPELVAIIASGNTASRRVAAKLGMTQRPECTFVHPVYEPGHPHALHCLHSLKKEAPSRCSTPS